MTGRSLALIVAIALLGLASGKSVRAQSASQAAAVDQSGAGADLSRLLADGKAIFVDKCARCHNEQGDKPLSTGAPLNQRALSTDKIAQAVNGRLRDRTDDERHAVTVYISSLMQNKASDTK